MLLLSILILFGGILLSVNTDDVAAAAAVNTGSVVLVGLLL